jgi:hypothetical protein
MKRAVVVVIIVVLVFVFLVTSLMSCAVLEGKKTEPVRKASVSKPAWVEAGKFVLSSTISGDSARVGAVGVEVAPDGNPCWSSGVLLAAVKNRALAELAKTFDTTPDSEAAIALLSGATVNTGWFDGDRTLYALAVIEKPRAEIPALSTVAVSGAVPIAQLEVSVREAGRAHLAEAGVCNDAHKRLSVACCGGAKTFCSDPARFDKGGPAGTCSCGGGDPCHQDYVCEERQGAKKCICRGASCPCEVRDCTSGQTCGDGRCY